MIRIKRPAAALGATAVLAVSLTACGGAPTDASTDDFCKAFNEGQQAIATSEDEEAAAEAINDWAESLEETGTPEDIPDDARKGFEVTVEVLGGIDADDLKDEDLGQALEDEYADDEADVEAYNKYAGEQCSEAPAPDEGGEEPEGDTTE